MGIFTSKVEPCPYCGKNVVIDGGIVEEHDCRIKGEETVDHIDSYIPKINFWAKSIGLIDYSTSTRQAVRAIGELADTMAMIVANDREEIRDSIGEVIVSMIILANMQGFTVGECLVHAYNRIRDRASDLEDTFPRNE